MSRRLMQLATTTLAGAGTLAIGLGLAAPAKADPVTGLYVGGGAGFNYREDQDLRGLTLPGGGPLGTTTIFPSGSVRLNSTVSVMGSASIGYGLGNGIRVELEGSYRQNKANKVEGFSVPVSAGGEIRTYAAMVNALYDFDFNLMGFANAGFTPYVGVGAGYAWTTLNKNRYTDNATFEALTDDTDGNFAAQGILGFAIPIAAVPGLSFTAEYRIFAQIGDTSFNGGINTPPAAAGVATTSTPARFKFSDSLNHSGLAGLRYEFNQPAPPPPVVEQPPQVTPTRSYLVFFDWDKATLTERARQIIHEAADNSTKVQYTRIEVNGYTDTSGTPRYNQGLSVRRAQAVAAELVRDGVPRQAITIQGFGETRLLVPTGPGVREPQNRRVEIIIR